jgi:hypothetical protein
MVLSFGFVSTDELDARKRTGVSFDGALLYRLGWARAGLVVGDGTFVRGQNILYGGRVGAAARLIGRLRADAFLDGGFQRYTTARAPLPAFTTAVETTSAVLPYVGGRVGLAWDLDRMGSWISASAMARTTTAHADGTYLVSQCDGPQPAACAQRDQPYRFGGSTFAVVLAAGIDFDLFAGAFPGKPER